MLLVEDAFAYALEAHRGCFRKKRRIPYILHPAEVAVIASTLTDDQEVIAAALLHDTVEDGGATFEEIRSRFGERVSSLVASETERKYRNLPGSETWRRRKEESLALLRDSEDPGVRMLWLSDKLANMRSFYREFLTEGDALWNGFNQNDPSAQKWYYRSVLELTSELSGTTAWEEYRNLTEKVFADIE